MLLFSKKKAHSFRRFILLHMQFSENQLFSKTFYGGHKAVARPDPIPNSAVKHRIADGSACIACARVGSRRTFPSRTPLGVRLFALYVPSGRSLSDERSIVCVRSVRRKAAEDVDRL